MIQVQALLLSIYKSNDFVNKQTNEVTEGKNKIQLLSVRKMKNGSEKKELLDISIPSHKVNLYKDKVGKEVTVEVGIIAKDYKFYGI